MKNLDAPLQADLISYFGCNRQAQEEGSRLLMSLGDPSTLSEAAAALPFGWRDDAEKHFSIHSSLVGKLPAVLRVFIKCGARLYGIATGADVITIHMRSRKLTFLLYDDFSRTPFPELHTCIKIDLPRLAVDFLSTASTARGSYFFSRSGLLMQAFLGDRGWSKLVTASSC